MIKSIHLSGFRAASRSAGKGACALAMAASLVTSTSPVMASSHSDAPLIKLDPQANLTDVYTFVRTRTGGEKVLVVEVSVHPFCEPGDGVMYDAFSPDAQYSISIANPVTGAEVQRFDFQFSTPDSATGNYKNKNTILRYGRGTAIGAIQTVGDAQQNFTQTYTVTRTISGTALSLTGSKIPKVAPPNVGLRTTPSYNDPNTGRAVSGATTTAGLDAYTAQTICNLPVSGVPTGYNVWAGQREDGFFADTPGIFDLLDPRILGTVGNTASRLGQGGDGVDGFKGYNVLHYAIEIPLSTLPSYAYTGLTLNPAIVSGSNPNATPIVVGTAAHGVGVYASVSRPRTTLRQSTGADQSTGPFVQVNRLANPLFNEVLVALSGKDAYNRSLPTGDANTFATFAQNPEVAVLINAVFGTNFATSGRSDLALVYIPDVIRVDTTTGATKVSGETGFNRLSFIGGDLIPNGSGVQIAAGWPNGRRFGDDVVDIALTAVASGPTYNSVFVLGDNINNNDQVYNRVFPYAGTPNSGPRNTKDSGPNVGVASQPISP